MSHKMKLLFLLVLLVSILLLRLDIFADAEFELDDVSEGPCISPRPTPVSMGWNFIKILPKLIVTNLYVPLGSEHMYRHYAMQIIGKNPNSIKELKEMKLRIKVFLPYIYWNQGFDDESFTQFCTPSPYLPFSFMRQTCLSGIGTSVMARKNHLSLVRDTLVWTDYTNLLYIRCADGRKDWKVVSLSPEVPDEARRQIYSVIKYYGFNETRIVDTKY